MTTLSNVDNVNHSYGMSGDFNVTLTATSDQGCIDSVTEVVTVSSVTADFTADHFSGCSPHCIEFSDLSTTNSGVINQWEWSFSDGSTYSIQDPSSCFVSLNNNTPDSLYDAQLVVYNNLGCKDSLLMPGAITVYDVPGVDFTYTPEEISSINPTVTFQNLSDAGDVFTWQFGEEFFTNEFSPTHTFDGIGFIEVTLVSSTFASCSDTASQFIRINPEETIYVPNSFTPDEDGLNDLFFPVINGAIVDFYDFKMYDRYGHVIFETEDHLEKWNGQFEGYTENYTTDGLYPWRMRVKFEGSTETILKEGVLRVFR